MKYFKIFFAIAVLMLATGCSEELLDVNGKGTVKGRVVQDLTFVPLENVKISTNPASNTVFTDANGEFILPADVGQYAVQAQKDGFLVSFESVTVEVGEEVQIVFELKLETANNRSPEAATAIAPVDGATNVPFNVELEWEAVDVDEDDLTYTITLRNGTTNTVQTFTDLTIASQQVTVDFGTTYFWQVAVDDGFNTPVNSAVFTFTTENFPTNRFLFVKKENGNNVIYSGNGSGGQVAITANTTNSWRPRMNRQANKIAYLRNVGAAVHVFTMNADGSNKQQITTSVPVSGFNFDEIDISWATNGASIYYPSQDKLYRINSDGSGLTQIYQTVNGNLITEVDVNGTVIALKTNNLNGYGVQIFTINTSGTLLQMVQTGLPGAAGGINLSADNTKLLFTRDTSGFENNTYRQLDTRVFLYTFSSMTALDVSFNKVGGTNDLDARFSPTEAEVIVTNVANDGVTPSSIQTLELSAMDTRTTKYGNSFMPDWE
jgi:Tol biopolymer transport system component